MSYPAKAIGGYFELELPSHIELHSNAIALNSGRFCLEYILRCRKYSMVYVPFYTCDSAIEPIIKLNIPYKFYHIDENYRIIDNITLLDDEALMYTNYWGLQDDYCLELAQKYGSKLIFDYTQAFFSNPILGIDTFYSCRKFFGVPDGGYVYTDANVDFDIDQDVSYSRLDSLIKRIDISPEAGYDDFRKCSDSFHNMPIRRMSNFTKRMMGSIDYQQTANIRRENYNILQQAFGGKILCDSEVPMIFPYKSENGQTSRSRLIQNRIFVAKYWPNVDDWAGKGAVETNMANNILPLPIDQRYDVEDMKFMIDIIQNYEK